MLLFRYRYIFIYTLTSEFDVSFFKVAMTLTKSLKVMSEMFLSIELFSKRLYASTNSE